MADPNLKITVSGDTSKADAALDKLQQHGENIAKNVGASLGKTFQFNQVVQAAETAMRYISPLVKRGAEEARESAEAQAMLNATAAESVPIINAYAQAEMKRLAIDDDVIVKLSAQIAARGESIGLQGEELRMATQLGIQFGALKGNYESAAQAIGKYIGDEDAGLKGINVEAAKGKDLHERLDIALRATAGGMRIAEAQANTQEGALRGLNLQIDEYLGKLAATVTDNPKVVAAIREFTDLIADEVASGNLKQLADDVGDFAHELVQLAKLGKDLQPLFDFLGGKWFIDFANKGDNLLGKPMRDFIFGAKEAETAVKDVETVAIGIGDAFGIATDNVEEMTSELKKAADEEKKIAAERAAADEQYYAWKEWREKTYAEKRKAAYDSMMEHIKQLDEEHLARVQKELELRKKMLEMYSAANESSQGWMRQSDAQLTQIENVANKIAKAIKHGADGASQMNVATMASAQTIAVMADEMEQAAVAAERVKAAVLFTELARSSFTKPMDWEGTLRKKGIGTGSMDQLELAQIQYTRQMQELGPLQFGARMDTQSVLWALQLAIQDLQLSLREQQIKGQTKPAGTRENPIYIEAADPGNSATLIGVA